MRLISLLVIVLSLTTPALADEAQAPENSQQTSEDKEASMFPIKVGTGDVAQICRGQFTAPVARTACEVYVHKMRESDIEYEVYALGIFQKQILERLDVTEQRAIRLEVEVDVLRSQVEVLIDRVAELEANTRKEE